MHEQAYQLCMEIEQLPASEQQTKVSVMAADLLREMEATEADLVAANCMLEDSAHKIVQVKDAFHYMGQAYHCALAQSEQLETRLADHSTPRPLDEWSEEDGPALWWKFPVDEPPYCGSPLYSDWPGYHTHWTKILMPNAPEEVMPPELWKEDTAPFRRWVNPGTGQS